MNWSMAVVTVLALATSSAAQQIVPEPAWPRPDFASQARTFDPARAGVTLPIVELPSVDRTGKNGLRAVFADTSEAGKVHVHLVFADEDSPGRGKLLDRTYDAFRWFRYRRVMDVETLTFELDRTGKYKAVEFHGTFSGEQTWQANPPEHKTATIPYSEFRTQNGRPVVVVNTWNHLLSNTNTNPNLAMVQASNYPVYAATRAQLKAMFERTWSSSFRKLLDPTNKLSESTQRQQLNAVELAKSAISPSDAGALGRLEALASAELEAATRVGGAEARAKAVQNQSHVERMVAGVRANAEALRGAGVNADVAATAILFSDLGKSEAALDAHARKVFPQLYQQDPAKARFKAFLLHEEVGLERFETLAKQEGLSAETTQRVVNAIAGHNGPATKGSWWARQWKGEIQNQPGNANSKLLGKPYPTVIGAEGMLSAALDRVDQGSLRRNASGWSGGPKKILSEVVEGLGLTKGVQEALGSNPSKTAEQLEALRARAPLLFETSFVQDGLERVRATSSLLNHVEFTTDARGQEIVRVHNADGVKTVTTAEALWSELDRVERPLSVKAWTPEGRRLLAETAPQTDRFAEYRRADGTVDWKRAGGGAALGFAKGTVHFAFALFLKELAIVAATGDRRRIEEFFDALMTTDFYVQYGLFVAGAKVADVAYTRYLQRFVRPTFISGVLKTNLVLATGMALPLIVEGRLEAKTFAISVASLGLSVTAVQLAASKIPAVQTIRAAQQSGALAKVGATAGRLARLGGWVYTAVELALILTIAEEVDKAINAQVARIEAVAALAEATRALDAAVHEPAATPESLAAAASALRGAWIDYRNGLYAPVEAEEAFFVHRLEKLAKTAKLASDERNKTLEVLANNEALRANIESRYGSIDAYADYLAGGGDASVDGQLAQELADYAKKRDALFDDVYTANRRDTALLGEDPSLGQIEGALSNASRNRLEAYADEAEVLIHYRSQLLDAGREDLAAVLSAELLAQQRLEQADRDLISESASGGGLLGGVE